MEINLDREKFISLVRHMIIAAEDMRFARYFEINKATGIPLQHIGFYAGALGDFCLYHSKPCLNALIIGSTNGRPGDGFAEWATVSGEKKNWGDHVADCLSYFHLQRDIEERFRNTSGINDEIDEFLEEGES